MVKRFIIGLDGGHDLADCMIFDTKCKVNAPPIERFCGLRPINHHYMPDCECIHNLDLAIKVFAAYFGFNDHQVFMEEIECICLSLAGAIPVATSGKLRNNFEGAFPDLNFIVVDDTWAGLAAETDDAKGICAFAGYGASVSVVIDCFNEDKKYKLDGWGPIIGDFGSGFELATEVFRQLGRDYDRGTTPSFYEKLRIESINNSAKRIMPIPLPSKLVDVQKWFDNLKKDNPVDWHVRLASLAFYFLEYVENNPEANHEKKIIEKVANNLVDTIHIALDNFSEQLAGCPLILQGEMFRSSIYYDAIRRSMKKHLDSGRLSDCIISRNAPSHGALVLALRSLKYDIDNLGSIPVRNIDTRSAREGS